MSNEAICFAVIIIFVIIFLVYKPKKISNPQQVLLFYRDGCPFCEIFKPEWAKIENVLQNKAKKFNTADPKSALLATQYKVSGVPSIILLGINNTFETYLGSRTADDIIARLT